MSQRFVYLLKNVGVLTISNFASKILVILLIPLYTSILTTEEYGIYDLLFSVVPLVFPVLTLNIVDAVMRFCMDKANAKEEIAIIGIKYVIISIGVIGVGLFFLYHYDLFPTITAYLPYFFIYYISYALNQYFLQLAKGHEQVKDMGVAGVISTVILLGANILFLCVLKIGLVGYFIASILSQFVPVLYYFIRLKYWRCIKVIKYNSKLEKEMLLYCIPLIATVLSWWVNNAADKYVVTLLYGIAANGVFSVAYKIPSILQTLHAIFIQAWQISAIKEYGADKASEFYGCIFLNINIASAIACAVLILLCKPIAYVLYAKEFYAAWQYVPFLLISSIINSASGLLGPILSAKKDSKSMAFSAIYGAVVNMVLNFILIYAIGIQGATIATLIASFVIYYMRKRAVKEELKIESYWTIVVTWLLLIILAMVEIYTTIWYFEIVIVLFIVLINIRAIKGTLGLIIKIKN